MSMNIIQTSDLIQELKWYRSNTIPDMQPEYVEEIINILEAQELMKTEDDNLRTIKAYDFALSQYKETLEELIENNDGDVKEICVFLLNLLRIKEIDIEKGFYI